MAMNIQRINFDPIGGDSVTAALRKVDLGVGEIAAAVDGDGTAASGIANRLTSAERRLAGLGGAAMSNIGITPGTVAAGDDVRFTSNANAAANALSTANQKLNSISPSSSGTHWHDAGTLGASSGGALVPHSTTAATGNNDGIKWYVYRFQQGAGWDKCTWIMRREVDGTAQGSVEFGQPASGSAVVLGDGSGYTVKVGAGGNMYVSGNIVAGGTVSWSDETLKEHIESRPVTRGMALALAKNWCEWDFVESKTHDLGVTAQQARNVCAHHVFEVDYTARGERDESGFYSSPDPVKKLGIDKTGIALEASMDNALAIEELKKDLAEAMARIGELEVSSRGSVHG